MGWNMIRKVDTNFPGRPLPFPLSLRSPHPPQVTEHFQGLDLPVTLAV
jgi:hypothetical protein